MPRVGAGVGAGEDDVGEEAVDGMEQVTVVEGGHFDGAKGLGAGVLVVEQGLVVLEWEGDRFLALHDGEEEENEQHYNFNLQDFRVIYQPLNTPSQPEKVRGLGFVVFL